MNILETFKVDIQAQPAMFEGAVTGRTLILDADSACYAATADVAQYATAIRRFTTLVYEAMFLTKADHCRAHLTPKGCIKNNRGRMLGVKPYQGNRQGKNKPPLLEMLRENASGLFQPHENVEIYAHYQYEADDAVMMDAYAIEDAVVWSEDKDLLIVPCPLYDIKKHKITYIDNRFGYLDLRTTNGGKVKVTGRGTAFFWFQMLAGDTADNVKGILSYGGRLCGETTAYRLLKNITEESDAANLVLDEYRKINQNPLPEAWCLWLLRWAGDTCYEYITSLDLSDENRTFLEECYERKWFTDEEAQPFAVEGLDYGSLENETGWELPPVREEDRPDSNGS